MRRLIILGAGLYYKRTIEVLVKGGFYVIALDKNPEAEGRFAAHEFYAFDIVDKNAVLTLAKEKKIDGIMNVNEFGSRTACFVASTLGLNGHSYDTVEATNDKGIMRDKWLSSGLTIPQYKVFDSWEDAKKSVDEIGYPCILKPADSGGSGRGISVLKSELDIKWAYDFAEAYARNGRFIVESYIEGVELTVETFSINKRVFFLAMSDKIKPELKTRVATSLNYPAMINDELRDKVETLVSDALNSLGLINGIAHTEVIVNKKGTPFLIETGARGGGGHIFHTIIEAVSGINAPLLQANWLTGQNPEIGYIQKNGCCYRFFNPERGILKSVNNLERATKIRGVIDLGIVKKVGEEVGNLENSLQRTGFVVTKGIDRQDAIDVADEVEGTLTFEVKPLDI
jgi:biotin carboxylase